MRARSEAPRLAVQDEFIAEYLRVLDAIGPQLKSEIDKLTAGYGGLIEEHIVREFSVKLAQDLAPNTWRSLVTLAEKPNAPMPAFKWLFERTHEAILHNYTWLSAIEILAIRFVAQRRAALTYSSSRVVHVDFARRIRTSSPTPRRSRAKKGGA